jgi:hypothetical protein
MKKAGAGRRHFFGASAPRSHRLARGIPPLPQDTAVR